MIKVCLLVAIMFVHWELVRTMDTQLEEIVGSYRSRDACAKDIIRMVKYRGPGIYNCVRVIR